MSRFLRAAAWSFVRRRSDAGRDRRRRVLALSRGRDSRTACRAAHRPRAAAYRHLPRSPRCWPKEGVIRNPTGLRGAGAAVRARHQAESRRVRVPGGVSAIEALEILAQRQDRQAPADNPRGPDQRRGRRAGARRAGARRRCRPGAAGRIAAAGYLLLQPWRPPRRADRANAARDGAERQAKLWDDRALPTCRWRARATLSCWPRSSKRRPLASRSGRASLRCF